MKRSLREIQWVLLNRKREVESELLLLTGQKKDFHPKEYAEKYEQLNRTLYGIEAHLTDLDNLIESES